MAPVRMIFAKQAAIGSVSMPTRYELIINLQTAKALGRLAGCDAI